jgi:hypothetical protein
VPSDHVEVEDSAGQRPFVEVSASTRKLYALEVSSSLSTSTAAAS